MSLVALEQLLAEIWSQHTRLSWGLVCQCGWVRWHSAQEATGDSTESFLYVVSMRLILNCCSISTPTTREAVCFLLSWPRELMGKLLMDRESAYSVLINIKMAHLKKIKGGWYIYIYQCFAGMYVYVPCVPTEAQREGQIPCVVTCYVGAGNHTWILWKNGQCWATSVQSWSIPS